jgi:hypothetical protein
MPRPKYRNFTHEACSISGLMKKAAPHDSDLINFGIRLSSRAAFYEFCSDIT